MPIPKRRKDEDKDKYIQRCMSNEVMKQEYPSEKQRIAVCMGQTRSSLLDQFLAILGVSLASSEIEPLTDILFTVDADLAGEFDRIEAGVYQYVDPITFEVFLFDRKGNWRKNGRYLKFERQVAEIYYRRKLS